MKMYNLKLKYERYNKQFQYLVYITLTLIAFNILYLQNNLIIKWMYKNSEFHITKLKNNSEYHILSEDELSFWDVSVHAEDITKTNLNIFFIETTCCTENARFKYEFERNGMILSIRQACAIESTAYLNKNHTIYLLYSCPINESIFKKTSKEIIQIFRHSNVKLVKLNVYKYFEGTPVEDLWTKGVLDKSNYPVEHNSDVLRFLTLWKYGGSYIDLDVISTRSLYELRANFAAYETKTAIGSAVINFKSDGIGYNLLTQMLYYLNRFFDGTKWSNNGPDLVTKTLLNLCSNGQKIEEDNKIICDGFTIYQPEVFYPLPWNEWEMYFQENNSFVTLQRIKNSFVVHFWNKKSNKVKVYVGSRQPYEILAEKYCQLVHSAVKIQKYSSY